MEDPAADDLAVQLGRGVDVAVPDAGGGCRGSGGGCRKRRSVGESGIIQVLWKNSWQPHTHATRKGRYAVYSAHFGAKTDTRSRTAGRRRPGAAAGAEEGRTEEEVQSA